MLPDHLSSFLMGSCPGQWEPLSLSQAWRAGLSDQSAACGWASLDQHVLNSASYRCRVLYSEEMGGHGHTPAQGNGTLTSLDTLAVHPLASRTHGPVGVYHAFPHSRRWTLSQSLLLAHLRM